jgi:hypothetical protein
MALTVQTGRYYAGIDRPWIVSQGMVRNALVGYGATGIQFHDRDVPLPVNPRADPTYSDDWDEWIELDYSGPAKQIDTSRRWAWLVFVPATVPAGGPAPGAEPVQGSEVAPPRVRMAVGRAEAAVWIGAGVLLVMFLHAGARRKYGRAY